MTNTNISFIGAGNMAGSLIGGLVADGWDTNNILVSDPDPARREAIRSQYPVHSGENNISVIEEADIVVLAVKPQIMHQVAKEIRDIVQQKKPLIISIAAGIREQTLSQWLGDSLAIVRSMPNTPALVQSGATGLFANNNVSTEQRDLAETILRAVGLTLWLSDESQMDAVTALSGSGPAYFFYIMEAMEQAGCSMGLSDETARLLTLQTAFGAAKMALECKESTHELRERVTSPGGTTEKALGVLEDGQLKKLFGQALKAAQERSIELADMLGKSE
jgi:pyrroline-5-carboxylate reductase